MSMNRVLKGLKDANFILSLVCKIHIEYYRCIVRNDQAYALIRLQWLLHHVSMGHTPAAAAAHSAIESQ